MQLLIRPAAQANLLEQAEYYDERGGEELGSRFIAACEAGFARLSMHPSSGSPVRFPISRLEGCRFILTPGFEKTLISKR